jgi:bifunctional DNA-binding transcriptional regulator/antitoxin component of YhaV-PrlF toxin-antitoxin module
MLRAARRAEHPDFSTYQLTHRTMLKTTIVKVQKKGCITIPWHLRTEAGIEFGETMNVSVEKGRIIFTPHRAGSLKKKSGAKFGKTPGKSNRRKR